MEHTPEKPGIANLYQKTSEILELAGSINPNDYQKEGIHTLISQVEADISTHYPLLKSFLMPRVEDGIVLPPEKWENLKVQQMLQDHRVALPYQDTTASKEESTSKSDVVQSSIYITDPEPVQDATLTYEETASEKQQTTITDKVLSDDYIPDQGRAPDKRKLSIEEMYDTTVEILASTEGHIIPEAHKERIQGLMDLMEYNASEHYPNLRSIFMPRVEEREYISGTEKVITAPERWEEPLLNDPKQGLLPQFKRTIHPSDGQITPGAEQQDPVYWGIVNPDIRKRIEDRSMTTKEYDHLKRVLDISDKQASTSQPNPDTQALTVREGGQLALRRESDLVAKLDRASNGLLAIESGFTHGTVAAHRENGLSGQEIVDEKYTIDSMRTSGELIHRLNQYDVPDIQKEDFIEVCRDIGVSVKMVLEHMESAGVSAVEEMIESVSTMRPEIVDFANERGWYANYVWKRALEIFSQEGGGHPDKTIDILLNQPGFSPEFNEFD